MIFRRRTVLLAAIWVLTLHVVLQELRVPLFVLGPLDWSAHVATALILLANLPLWAGHSFGTVALVAAMAIDVDHVPAYLGTDILTEGTPRPYTHSLATVLLSAGVAVALDGRARMIAIGIATGVLAHLLRDIATGDGVALLWPLTQTGVRVPFWIEAAAIAALATRAWQRAGRATTRSRLTARTSGWDRCRRGGMHKVKGEAGRRRRDRDGGGASAG